MLFTENHRIPVKISKKLFSAGFVDFVGILSFFVSLLKILGLFQKLHNNQNIGTFFLKITMKLIDITINKSFINLKNIFIIKKGNTFVAAL